MGANATSFKSGNRAALTHGGRSQRERERVRRQLVGSMQSLIAGQLPEHERSLPGTSLLVDMAAVQAADVRQLRDYVDFMGGPISDRGQLRKCIEMLRARERDLVATLDRLGFGPHRRAQIAAALGAVRSNGLATQLAVKRIELDHAVVEGRT